MKNNIQKDENYNKLTKSQQQLVNSILNRKDLEIEAFFDAKKELTQEKGKKVSDEELKKRQKEILDKKTAKQQKEYEKQVINEEIDKELLKWKEQEIKETEERKQKVNEILNEIKIKNDTEYSEKTKRRDEWERRQTEKFREKYKIRERKRENLLEQLRDLERKEKLKERNKDKMDDKKTDTDKKSVYETNPNKNSKIKITDLIKNSKLFENTQKKVKQGKRKIVNYKIIKGIKTYIHNMEFYEANKRIILPSKQQTKLTKQNKSFREYLHEEIDHYKAIQNSQNSKQIQKELKTRYI